MHPRNAYHCTLCFFLACIIAVAPTLANAADIVLGGNANWSTCKAGSPPAADDTIYLGSTATGYILTLDGIAGAIYTCVAIKAQTTGGTANSGTIALTNGPATVNANLQAGTVVLFTPGAKTVVVNGVATGGGTSASCIIGTSANITLTEAVNYGLRCGSNTTANVGTSTASTLPGILMESVSANVTVGTSNAGSTDSIPGTRITAGTLTLTNSNGGGGMGAYGCQIEGSSAKTVNITNSTGGSGQSSHGLLMINSTASNTTVTVGTAKGGTHASASGALNYGGGMLIINGTDLTGVGPPAGGSILKIADGVILKYQDANGNAKKFYGDSEMPAAADVRHQTQYGLTDYTGSLRVPAANKVLSAEPVDAGTGTLTLPDAANVWYGSGAYGVGGTGSTPSKRASSITNCTPANVKARKTIDDVTGTYTGGGHE